MNQQPLALEYEERKIKREVEVKLQPNEVNQIAVNAGDVYAEIQAKQAEFDDVEKEFKERKETFKNQLGALEKKRDEMLAKINLKKETRIEDCLEKRFFATNTLQIWHGETLIEERAMTDLERRRDMFRDAQEAKSAKEEIEAAMTDSGEGFQREDIADAIRSETSSHTKQDIVTS